MHICKHSPRDTSSSLESSLDLYRMCVKETDGMSALVEMRFSWKITKTNVYGSSGRGRRHNLPSYMEVLDVEGAIISPPRYCMYT